LVKECEKHRIINTKGHAFNPGIRISSYNAMPIEGVVLLCQVLMQFKKDHPISGSLAKM